MFCPARHFLWLGADIFLIKPAFLAFSLPLCGFYYSLRLIFFLVKLAFHAFSLSCIIHLAIHRQTLLYLLAGLAFSAPALPYCASLYLPSLHLLLLHLLLPYLPFLHPALLYRPYFIFFYRIRLFCIRLLSLLLVWHHFC